MGINKPELIRLLDLADQLIATLQMPLFASKHSKKTFTNHQLFKLLVVKTFERKDYRGFEEYLKTSIVPEYLGIDRIPHFTTLQKFAQRQNIQNLEKVLLKFVELTPKKMKNGGFDATGLRISHASEHYEKRIERPVKKKDFLKANFFFDLENLLILAVKMRKKKRNDIVDMKPLWNKIKHLDFKNVFGDKAYDAEWFHELIFGSGKKSKIHLKNEDVPIHRTKGTFRKKMKRMLTNKKKGKRSLVECIISILKRVFGDILTSRKLATQKIELLFRIITCNLLTITRNIFCAVVFIVGYWNILQKIAQII
ncbi:transposase [Candidatus Woesearchaeota archaeon]|nr:transposase [Candidatus Woesearchaeota archaeon]